MVHMGWLTFCLTNYYMKKKSIDKSKLVLYHKLKRSAYFYKRAAPARRDRRKLAPRHDFDG